MRFRGDGGVLVWVPVFGLFWEEAAGLVIEVGAVVVSVWGLRRLASI